MHQAKPMAGMGMDNTRVRNMANMPREAKAQMLGLLRSIESTLTWPNQSLTNVVGLSLKPDGKSERPIAQTNSVYRLWGSCRKGLVVSWGAAKAGHWWDKAVRGSSPLRAAMLRLIKSEVAQSIGLEQSLLLWDVSKFC